MAPGKGIAIALALGALLLAVGCGGADAGGARTARAPESCLTALGRRADVDDEVRRQAAETRPLTACVPLITFAPNDGGRWFFWGQRVIEDGRDQLCLVVSAGDAPAGLARCVPEPIAWNQPVWVRVAHCGTTTTTDEVFGITGTRGVVMGVATGGHATTARPLARITAPSALGAGGYLFSTDMTDRRRLVAITAGLVRRQATVDTGMVFEGCGDLEHGARSPLMRALDAIDRHADQRPTPADCRRLAPLLADETARRATLTPARAWALRLGWDAYRAACAR